jgi:predicted site-specific integrase-resolvase
MTELTVKEYAAHERVDERTVRRWITKGAVTVRRTPGGGIRIQAPRRFVVVSVDKASTDSSGQPTA